MGEIENIENALKDIINSLQMARLYSTAHAIFKNSAAKAYNSLTQVLRDRHELVIGIIGEELVFEKEVFFELSKLAAPMIAYLKQRGIERIVFQGAIQRQELEQFMGFLSETKEDKARDPQDYLVSLGIRNISVGKIKVSFSKPGARIDEETREFINYLMVYDNYQAKSYQSIDSVLNNESVDYLSLRLSVNNMVENLTTRHQELLKLTTLRRYDLRTFTHIINVSILSMHFASKLGFSRDDVLDIGIAALFHDVGKLYISRKLINKQDKLSSDEFEVIKSHAILGTEILLKYVNTLGVLPAVVAFEHHLKYDLTGYPRLAFAQKPNIASMIVSICDVYDALSQRRSYKNEYPPEMIYDFMIKEKDKMFEGALAESFFKIMGVWPIGTIVALSDSRIAVVRQENEADIFLPKVEVVHPADKKEFLDLSQGKPGIKIERALNPFTEAKEYLSLV